MSDTDGYGSASTLDRVIEKAYSDQPESDSQNGVWRQTTSTLGKACDRDVSSHHCFSIYTQKT